MITSKLAAGDFGQIFEAVTDDDFGPRIGPRIAADCRHVLAGETDDLAIDLDHHGPLDRAMLQHATQHAAVARPDDQHAPRLAMRQQRHVRDHLLIDELVRFGDLDAAVEHQYAAVTGTLEDQDVLIVAFDPRQLHERRGSAVPNPGTAPPRTSSLRTGGRAALRSGPADPAGTPPAAPEPHHADRMRHT